MRAIWVPLTNFDRETGTGCARWLIFRYSRLLALLVGAAFLVVGVPIAMATRTPQEAQRAHQQTEARTEAKQGSYDDVEANPEDYIAPDLTFDLGAGIATVSGTLTNSAPYVIKDIKLRCRAVSESGKVLSQPDAIVYKLVPANGSVRFTNVNLGLVDTQVAQISCQATDADIVPGAAFTAPSK